MMTHTLEARRRGGHTLWEMLLVLAVLGAIAALAAPAVRLVRTQAGDVSQVTQDIVALLESARLSALQLATTVEVRLDPSTGHAWVFAAEGDTLRLVSTPTLPRLSMTNLFVGAEPRVRYTFTADGQSFGRPLVFRGAGEMERVVVDPWTGGARVTR